MSQSTSLILAEVANERRRQDRKFQPPPRPDHSPTDWFAILGEEVGEAGEEVVEIRWAASPELAMFRHIKLRAELIQVAAVAVAWVEHIDALALTEPEADRPGVPSPVLNARHGI